MENYIDKKKIFFASIIIIALKSIFFFTKHIQEDALISWRVARNIIEYGVYGYNGVEKISASTTHLYVFVGVIFQTIFGEGNFIYPLLIFNTILLTIGIYWLGKLLLNSTTRIILFIFFVSFLPPAIKMSILGMEFGMLFFFYIALMKFGFVERKKWAFVLLPILILWTRIDTCIFLGLLFIYDVIQQRKWNTALMIGGILAVLSVVSFNWFYFGEIVNNTITSKRDNYPSLEFQDRLEAIKFFTPNYFGIIKFPTSIFNFSTPLFFIVSAISMLFLFKKWGENKKKVLAFLFIFGFIKSLIFGYANAWFDWYFWIPQLVLFIPIILIVLDSNKFKTYSLVYFILIFIPFTAYQAVHSIATGHGEWNHARKIGLYLDSIEKDKDKYIFLEPAGYIPYFSKLKVIDYVGLVDKRLTEEKIVENGIGIGFSNLINKAKPEYILEDFKPMFKGELVDKSIYEDYELIKEFKIADVAKSDNPILDKIYKFKPSGRDFYLYKRKSVTE
ncbi:hypothetical protein [Faecalibacter macacae]|uniref:Glycosyltransferase RgtA/B/C/D-like domain-containing protein n=1 Tax=Faecalibacter macacae TaxID=1859289 RepID=A0A3L9MQ63_9FLAO|nr:hypothetical protein [Faecalibacter macacae]RLZ12729.1 hypothetical protein EAH69_00825 [Faecalibacter macacae]